MVRTSKIEAEVHVPTVVEVPEGAETVEITVRADLRNATEDAYVLHNVGDDAHFWHVLNENQREVIRDRTKQKKHKKSDEIYPVRTLTVPAGLSTHETVTLELDAKKLKDGKTYTVRSENWGQLAEATFVVIRPQKAEAPPKKKRAPKKSTTKKRTTKKSPAKKSTARKTTKKK